MADKLTRKPSLSPEKRVEAMPTKALFIDMLTRDITLVPAIVDLVDNSVDGATGLRGDKSFKGLSVRVHVSRKRVRVEDNCGGIDVDTARRYAFRFGRPGDAPFVKHSIGKFGVGMKRAFFKLGRKFEVVSRTNRDRFILKVDVLKWAKKKEWDFTFDEVEEGLAKASEAERKTTVTVRDLHPEVSEEIELPSFEGALAAVISARLQDAIARKLRITLNGIPIGMRALDLLDHPLLAPAYKKVVYRHPREKPVRVRLYCGLGPSERAREMAGWHVFCNGRLVLEADKTDMTGWGEHRETRIPGFHGQYNSFRGYAYFDSDDAGKLPWTTAKTAVNTDSSIYRTVRQEMMNLMEPVLRFLDRLKKEKEQREDPGDKGPLQSLVESATPKPVSGVSTRAVFEIPEVKEKKRPSGPEMQKVQYEAPLAQINRAKRALGVASFKKVGEGTFKYFYDAECKE